RTRHRDDGSGGAVLSADSRVGLFSYVRIAVAMIKLVGVEKALGGQRVLQGVDLDIPPGKLTTIIGRSGEGKSVLLKHMIGLLQPDRGQVFVGGIEISLLRGKALNDVRKRFAMLFQGAALFDSLSVFENVAFPLREKLRMKGPEVGRRVEETPEHVGVAGVGAPDRGESGASWVGGNGPQVSRRIERGYAQAGWIGTCIGHGAGDHPL